MAVLGELCLLGKALGSKIDLHIHSTASDGVYTPEQVVRLALDAGLEIIALADHDTTDGIDAAQRAAQGTSLSVWPSIEIGTDVTFSEVHILGYFIDRENKQLQKILQTLRGARRQRAFQMVQKLAELGMPIEWERVLEIAGGGTVGRPHVAEAMCEKGYVNSVVEAFRLYIGRNAPAYVERYKLSPKEAVELVAKAKGLPAFAHPVDTGQHPHGEPLDIENILPDLVQAGLKAMECYYPGYDEETVNYLLALAKRWNLIPTGGSDFHGRDHFAFALGQVWVPPESAERLLALHQQQPHVRH